PTHEPVEEAGDARQVEPQVGRHATDQRRGGLESERRAAERRLLRLIQSHEVDAAERAELVACREAEDRRRCHREEAALLEAGSDRYGTAAEIGRARV